MKLPNLLHELVCKFVPMDDVTKMNLQVDGGNEYTKVRVSLEEKKAYNDLVKEENEKNKDKPDYVFKQEQKLTIPEKVIQLCETVWARYLFAMLFVILVPVIRNWINGEAKEEEPEHEPSDMELFMEFQRMRQSQR